jgi:hypothetical protein
MSNDLRENESAEHKDAKYPCNGYRAALKVASAVNNLGGNQAEVPKSLLAQALATADNATFSQLLGATKAFRLIQGRSEYTLTDLSDKIFHYTDHGERRQAELECFASPLAFRELIRRFDGKKLPSPEMMGNVLIREGNVPKSWALRVAHLFVNSAKDLELIDSGNVFRYEAELHFAASKRIDTGGLTTESAFPSGMTNQNLSQKSLPFPSAGSPATTMASAEGKANFGFSAHGHGLTTSTTTTPSSPTTTTAWCFPLPDGQIIRLETPEPLPRAAWEKLERYVQILKPAGSEGNQ